MCSSKQQQNLSKAKMSFIRSSSVNVLYSPTTYMGSSIAVTQNPIYKLDVAARNFENTKQYHSWTTKRAKL